MASRAPVAETNEALDVALKAGGYAKRASGVYTKGSNPDELIWVGLNRATDRVARSVNVNPVVGVRIQSVERLVAQLHSEPDRKFYPPTVSSPLGHLMPSGSYRTWTFSTGADNRATAHALVDAVSKFGEPFAIFVVDDLLKAIALTISTPEHRIERLVAALVLRGDGVRARIEIGHFIGGLGARDDAAAKRMRYFQAALDEYLRAPD